MSHLAAANRANNWQGGIKNDRKYNLAAAGQMSMATGSNLNRISSSERNSRGLQNNMANEYLYKKPATMKYGTSMLDHNPSEDEVHQAGSALRLLKSKMTTNAPAGGAYGGSATKQRGYYDEETHEYNQYAPGPKKMGQDADYNSMYRNPAQDNYGKVFKPQMNNDNYGRNMANPGYGVNKQDNKAKALNRVNNYGSPDDYTAQPIYSKPPLGVNTNARNNYQADDYSDFSAKIPSRLPANKAKVNQTVNPNFYDDGYSKPSLNSNNYGNYQPSSGQPLSAKNGMGNDYSNYTTNINKGVSRPYPEPEDVKTFSKPMFKKPPPAPVNEPPQEELPIKPASKKNIYETPNQEGDDDEDESGPIKECPQGCGRSFNPKALAKHAKICKKVFQTKRKEFDSSKARETEEIAQVQRENKYNGYGPKKGAKAAPVKAAASKKSVTGKADWKSQSESFRANLKAARGGKLSKEETAAANDNSHLVPCDYCGRKFNDQAAARHIPFCQQKSKVNNIKGTVPKGRK